MKIDENGLELQLCVRCGRSVLKPAGIIIGNVSLHLLLLIPKSLNYVFLCFQEIGS